MSATESTGRPLLRILKCAYKLHKAGLTEQQTVRFIGFAQELPAHELPSAGGEPVHIFASVYGSSSLQFDEGAAMANALGLDVDTQVRV